MTQTLNVEYEELIARAEELEKPLPTLPSINPKGPCNLSFITDAGARLALNADLLRSYINGAHKEWKNLATSLRNAAKAYQTIDEGTADAINNESTTSGDVVAVNCDPDEAWTPPPPPPPPPPFEYPYYEVRQAAADIEAPDQGTSFLAFAQEWDAFQRTFRAEEYRFRGFVSWEGDARARVEQNFRMHKEWILSMATTCTSLGKQATTVVNAHRKATARDSRYQDHASEGAHPTTYEVSQCDYWYKIYTERYTVYLYMAIEWYERLQAQSETALNNYVQNGNLPLAPANPPTPPKATVISDPTKKPDPEEEEETGTTPAPTPITVPSLGEIGQAVGNISQGMQPAMQGFQGAMQGVQGMMQTAQGLGQGAGAAGSAAGIPAEFASETAPADAELVDETEKDKETNGEPENAGGETQPDSFAAGANAVAQALGGAPVAPQAPRGPETVL